MKKNRKNTLRSRPADAYGQKLSCRYSELRRTYPNASATRVLDAVADEAGVSRHRVRQACLMLGSYQKKNRIITKHRKPAPQKRWKHLDELETRIGTLRSRILAILETIASEMWEFSGFDKGDEPRTVLDGEGKTALRWKDLTMPGEKARDLMERDGTIMPEDFRQ